MEAKLTLEQRLIKVLEKIYLTANNHFVSVLDCSIGNICRENDVNIRYTPSITKVLRESGLGEFEGERSGMKYKIVTENGVPPHYSHLADLIIARYKQDLKNSESKSSDLRPPRKKEEKVEVLPPTFVKRTIPHLGDLVFILLGGFIVQCKVVGQKYSRENEKILVYDLKIPNVNQDSQISLEQYVENVSINKLFNTEEELLSYLHKHIKYFGK